MYFDPPIITVIAATINVHNIRTIAMEISRLLTRFRLSTWWNEALNASMIARMPFEAKNSEVMIPNDSKVPLGLSIVSDIVSKKTS